MYDKTDSTKIQIRKKSLERKLCWYQKGDEDKDKYYFEVNERERGNTNLSYRMGSWKSSVHIHNIVLW